MQFYGEKTNILHWGSYMLNVGYIEQCCSVCNINSIRQGPIKYAGQQLCQVYILSLRLTLTTMLAYSFKLSVGSLEFDARCMRVVSCMSCELWGAASRLYLLMYMLAYSFKFQVSSWEFRVASFK